MFKVLLCKRVESGWLVVFGLCGFWNCGFIIGNVNGLGWRNFNNCGNSDWNYWNFGWWGGYDDGFD